MDNTTHQDHHLTTMTLEEAYEHTDLSTEVIFDNI